MGFPPLLNLSTRLSTAALPGQTTKRALTVEFMFQNVAYRPTVYRTGGKGIQWLRWPDEVGDPKMSIFVQGKKSLFRGKKGGGD